MRQMNKGLHYEVIKNPASKENLVFIHGSGCNRKIMRPLARHLKNHNCYLIDLPAHGKSKDMKASSVEDYIDAVADFASKLKNVTLIGFSLGGTICLGVAAKAIPSVKRAVIISSGAKFDLLDVRFHEMVRKQKINWLYLMECLGSLHRLPVILSFASFEHSKVMLKDFEIDTILDLEPVISDIKIPVLIMVGDRDPLTPPVYSYRLRRAISHSRLIIVPGYRHMLSVANSRKVAYFIRRFIQRTCYDIN